MQLDSCVRKVTFFDNFAQDVDEKLNQQTDESFIIVIASAKVNKYEGNLPFRIECVLVKCTFF